MSCGDMSRFTAMPINFAWDYMKIGIVSKPVNGIDIN
jgi:hypothetical protein